MKPEPLRRWHEMVQARDLGGLDALLAEDATFESPIVFKPQVGKELTSTYLKAAGMLLLSAGTFRYVHEWYDERSAVLEFEAVVNGILVNGVDMIFWNAAGEIDRFKVMVRPLKAINLLHEAMRRLLAG
jgi:hypothetical protein